MEANGDLGNKVYVNIVVNTSLIKMSRWVSR